MLTPAKSAETWQALLELRCRREIVERWLANASLSDELQHSLQAVLSEIENQIGDHLRLLSQTRAG
jgi:hypothetical protein